MADFVTWLRATAVSEAFRVPEAWLWPLFESIHFLGLALVLGVAGFFDLRLLGFMKRIPLWKAAGFLPLAIVGLTLNVATGAYFYIAEPFQYSFNIAWWYKVAAIALAVGERRLFPAGPEVEGGGPARRRRDAHRLQDRGRHFADGLAERPVLGPHAPVLEPAGQGRRTLGSRQRVT